MSGIATPSLPVATEIDDVLGNNNGSTVRVGIGRLATLVSSLIGPAHKTRAGLFADLDWPSGSIGSVWGDSQDAYNGSYSKSGGSGSGSWSRIGDLPNSAVTEARIAEEREDRREADAVNARAIAAETADRRAAISAAGVLALSGANKTIDGDREIYSASILDDVDVASLNGLSTVMLIAPSTNTLSDAQLKLGSLSPWPIYRADGSALAPGDIRSGVAYILQRRSSTWRMTGLTAAQLGEAVAAEADRRVKADNAAGVLRVEVTGGSANAVTARFRDEAQDGAALTSQSIIELIPSAENTGPVTLKIGDVGPFPVNRRTGADLVAGDLRGPMLLRRFGNSWRMLGLTRSDVDALVAVEVVARRTAIAAAGVLALTGAAKAVSGEQETYTAQILDDVDVTSLNGLSTVMLIAPATNTKTEVYLQLGALAPWRLFRADGTGLVPGDIRSGVAYILQRRSNTWRLTGLTLAQVGEAVAVEEAARQAAITQAVKDTKQQVGIDYGLAARKGRTLAVRTRAIAVVHNADGVPVMGFDEQGRMKTSIDQTLVINAALSQLPIRAVGKGRQVAVRGMTQAAFVDVDGVPVAGFDVTGSLQARRPSGTGSIEVMGASGQYANFSGPAYGGYTLDGMTVRRNAAGEVYAPASAEMLGVFLYGQSYFGSNEGGGGTGGAVARLRGSAKMPLELLCLNDGRGAIGWNTTASAIQATGFVPYSEEIVTSAPSIAGPVGLRVAEDFHHRGQRMPVLVRSAARDGSRLEVLCPSDLAWHVPTNDPFDKLTRAVTNFATAARSLGLTPYVPAVFWSQGQSNRDTSYAQCVEWLTIIWTRIQDMVVAATGQRRKPCIVVCQSQSDQTNGNWEIMKAQVDMCKTRPDWVLGMTAWSSPQHDGTHHSSEGCITTGSSLGVVLGQLLLGRAWSAPFIRSARRDGNVITVQIGGQPVVEDTSIKTRRHYLSEKDVPDGQLTTPIPFAGFDFYPTDTASTAAITAYEVAPDGWSVKLTLSAGVPGRIAHAWRKATRRPSGAGSSNESANRGTLRARDTYLDSWTETGDVRFWMASDYADVA